MTLLTDRVGPATVVRDAPFPLLIASDVLDRASEQALGADHRQRDVMPHASGRFCGKEVTA